MPDRRQQASCGLRPTKAPSEIRQFTTRQSHRARGTNLVKRSVDTETRCNKKLCGSHYDNLLIRQRRSLLSEGDDVMFYDVLRVVFFRFDATAQQRLDGFSPNIDQQMSLRCYSLTVVTQITLLFVNGGNPNYRLRRLRKRGGILRKLQQLLSASLHFSKRGAY